LAGVVEQVIWVRLLGCAWLTGPFGNVLEVQVTLAGDVPTTPVKRTATGAVNGPLEPMAKQRVALGHCTWLSTLMPAGGVALIQLPGVAEGTSKTAAAPPDP
jgi:hypothetical protein